MTATKPSAFIFLEGLLAAHANRLKASWWIGVLALLCLSLSSLSRLFSPSLLSPLIGILLLYYLLPSPFFVSLSPILHRPLSVSHSTLLPLFPTLPPHPRPNPYLEYRLLFMGGVQFNIRLNHDIRRLDVFMSEPRVFQRSKAISWNTWHHLIN